MPEYDLLIRNAIVVTADGEQPADVAIAGERIAACAPQIAAPAHTTIDAAGCYLFPGFIDPHVHISLPIGNDLVSSDDFASGAIAAACGGVTCIIDFTVQARGVPLAQAVEERRAQADGKVAIDYGLHLTVMDAEESTLADLRRLAAAGYPSAKVYMTYPALMVRDDAFLRILGAAGQSGALTLVHAENHDIIGFRTAALLAAGQTAPRYHAESRPPWVEGEATGRAIALARAAGAPLYVVHVSCADALAPIVLARRAGLPVYGETCPHYLLLSDDEYNRQGFGGAKYVMTPPLRPAANQQPLWDALASADLDVVATDHCPWYFDTQKIQGLERFDRIPGGVAGVETRAALLFSAGVASGRLSPSRFADVMSSAPARLFGLYPRKGAIAVGSDADLVIFDPRQSGVIRHDELHQRVDYSIFEGWPVAGRPIMTISRGQIVARAGRFTGRSDHGRFVARQPRA